MEGQRDSRSERVWCVYLYGTQGLINEGKTQSYRAWSKLRVCGVYVGEHLSLRRVGKTPWESYGRQPDSGNPTVRECVQQRLASSVGESPTWVKVRNPVAWMAGRRETQGLKPIDKAILQGGERVTGP